ncbi:translation initiation factor IF-2 [Conoideocrella luteorostrata]|uniref:Translation initiation factor IF-2, mitochondrial n=1 Tax=Conoideocrella luteorostrata TaxID=1105319 RepID=A0AAJ0CW94_9HYPO|nr:translation initiation factor IF-2 [Conoideocrella luteorostrata]
MIRARAWTGHGHPFVCTSCRVPLSLINASTRYQAWATRSICLTPKLHDSNGSGDASLNRNFPGSFARVTSATSRPWGSFASVKKARGTENPANDGLLPHERAARNRTTSSEPTSAKSRNVTNQTISDGGTRVAQLGIKNRSSNNHEAQVKKSSTVLADVFKTMRNPQSPQIHESWPAGGPKTQHNANISRFGQVATSTSTSSQPAPRKTRSGHRKQNTNESLKHPPGGAPKQVGWGTFRHRKSQVPAHSQVQGHGHSHSHKHGSEFTLWSEITRPKRPKSKLQQKPMVSSVEHTPASKGSISNAVVQVQDFWGELDTRVADLNGGRHKDKTPQQSSKDCKEGDRQNERRKSRFEIEEESRIDDRRYKKSKKMGRGRRMEDEGNWDDESIHRWEQKQRRKAEREARVEEELQQVQPAIPIFLPEYINVSNLAQSLKKRPEQFLVDMEDMGFENVTPDTIMTGETAALISMEYGFEPTVDTGSQRDLKSQPIPENVSSLPSRPPVVTIMGHVDHGKTTLLDWLRKSSVAAQEHGGITQHIGAFVVKMSAGKHITFLDTPGHAAFLSMRQRGANVTDIVVLVVAADDSVMPQTVEAIKHATSAKVPIIVAINKIDKEDARVDQVKADLARHGVEIEDFGGDVQVVCVSGKTGQGMADLEENIITLSEILDVRAEYNGMAEGWILESRVKQNGKVATVLVKRGTLRPGDLIIAGKTWARIRVLRNEAGIELSEAPPGTPVEILGWRELPDAGEQVLQAPDEGKAKTAVEYRMEMAEREESSVQLAEQEQRHREKAAAEAATEASTPDQEQNVPTEPGILYQNFTVKADVVGSVEAVCGSILELGNHEIRPKILRSAAGQISEYDIDHAAASSSIIINFNIPVLPHIKQRAEDAKVKIIEHRVIYHVVDDAKAALSELLPMNTTTRVSGEADILQLFPINVKKRVVKNIAGCKVRNGSIKKSSLVKVLRKGKVIFDGKLDTLKHVKKDVMEMGKGTECGIGLEGFEDFQVDDQIQTYEEVKEKRTL